MNATINVSNLSDLHAKRKLYQRDLEENRAPEKQKYEDNSDSIMAHCLKEVSIGKTPKLSNLLNECNTRLELKQVSKKHIGIL